MLEINKDFDIILIQELSWLTIQSIPSLMSKEGKKIIKALNHLNWVTFSRILANDNNYPHIISYMNIHLISLCFSFQKNIFNYRNICCFSFFNNSNIFLLNIYSNSNQSALKYLKDTETNIQNLLIITGNFNIRNRDWDLEYSFHLVYSDLLSDITNAFDLSFSYLINPIPTRYLDNSSDSNAAINLIFLKSNFLELDNHLILPES